MQKRLLIRLIDFNKITAMKVASSPTDADRRLIALVRLQPALYDVQHQQYQDTVHKAALWRKIAQDLAMDIRLCRSRWFNMRDNYRKSIIRNQLKRRAGQPERVYKFTPEIRFLKPYFNLDPAHADTTGPLSDNAHQAEDSSAPFGEASGPAKRERSESPQSLQDLEMPQTSQFQAHPVNVFLACIEPTLKALPPYLLSLAKGEIFAAVQKYELRMLQADCHVSTSDSPSLDA
ncbi:uncharacterized protein LOC128675440 isoform X2 [Plodia interpunctella]|uniref:uncharacterized protein LOC128675440 isoform X2 n=1 Tax=Plodia interpunctella TaxID=58824 RepID=UPI002368654E|nr:uncharacterized protein LOC128675440 isoform X2 [Plodia interpunctella]